MTPTQYNTYTPEQAHLRHLALMSLEDDNDA